MSKDDPGTSPRNRFIDPDTVFGRHRLFAREERWVHEIRFWKPRACCFEG